jgi:hypothetical protein
MCRATANAPAAGLLWLLRTCVFGIDTHALGMSAQRFCLGMIAARLRLLLRMLGTARSAVQARDRKAHGDGVSASLQASCTRPDVHCIARERGQRSRVRSV